MWPLEFGHVEMDRLELGLSHLTMSYTVLALLNGRRGFSISGIGELETFFEHGWHLPKYLVGFGVLSVSVGPSLLHRETQSDS